MIKSNNTNRRINQKFFDNQSIQNKQQDKNYRLSQQLQIQKLFQPISHSQSFIKNRISTKYEQIKHKYQQFYLSTCRYCNIPIDMNQFGSYFRHNKTLQCGLLICGLCCYKQICRYHQLIDQKKSQQQLTCCGIMFKDIIEEIKLFIKDNCLICGADKCNINQYIINQQTNLYVGKQCYLQLINKHILTLSKYQVNLIKKLKQWIITSCSICNQLKYDKIDTTKQRQQLFICQSCYLKQIKNQYKTNQLIKKCCQCNQPQIYQKYGFFFNIGQKKSFMIRQFCIDIRISIQTKLYCSYCIYKQYLFVQKQNQKGQISKIYYYEVKKLFKQYFFTYCMVCGIKGDNKDKIYPINCFKLNIQSFICLKCGQSLQKHKQSNYQYIKYTCFPQLIKHLTLIKQYYFNENKSIYKKQLQNKLTLISQLKQQKSIQLLQTVNESKQSLRFKQQLNQFKLVKILKKKQPSLISQIFHVNDSSQQQSDENQLSQVLKNLQSQQINQNVFIKKPQNFIKITLMNQSNYNDKSKLRHCQICNCKQIIQLQRNQKTSFFFKSKTSSASLKPFLLAQFQGSILCHYCIFQKLISLKKSYQMEQISKVSFIKQQLVFQNIFGQKCFICGMKFKENDNKICSLFYAITNLQLGFCWSCQQILFESKGSMPVKGYMKLKVLLHEKQIWDAVKQSKVRFSYEIFKNRVQQKYWSLRQQLKNS